MRFCFFPSTAEVQARLDARFPTPAAGAVDRSKTEVTEALSEDLNVPANARNAIAAMQGAIALLDSGYAEGRVEYLRTATDLQVSKGAGLLAFTAIIAATAGIALDKVLLNPLALWLCLASAGAALLASLMALFVVWSSAPSKEQFATAASESHWLTTLLVARAWKSNLAVALGVLATLLLAGAGLARLLIAAAPAQPQATAPQPATCAASGAEAAASPALAGVKR